MRAIQLVLSIFFILLSFSPPSQARETVQVECIDLLLKADAGVLQIQQGTRTYLISGEPERSGELALFLADASTDPATDAKLMRFTAPDEEPRFIAALRLIENALGTKIFSVAEQDFIRQAKNEIQAHIRMRDALIASRATELLSETASLRLKGAKARAWRDLQADGDFTWIELSLRKKKTELAALCYSRLLPLGIDLYIPIEEIEAGTAGLARGSTLRFTLGK